MDGARRQTGDARKLQKKASKKIRRNQVSPYDFSPNASSELPTARNSTLRAVNPAFLHKRNESAATNSPREQHETDRELLMQRERSIEPCIIEDSSEPLVVAAGAAGPAARAEDKLEDISA